MARFYLHLHEPGTIVLDEEGSKLPGLEKALASAIQAARDIMAAEVLAGRLCLSPCIVVADKQGREVGRVRFGDAVTVGRG